MGILDSIKKSISGAVDKRREERERMQRLQQDARNQAILIFEEEYKKNALEVATRKAKQDAAKLSGLQKLRAVNRARRMTEPNSNFMNKFSQFTQSNISKREENIKRTMEIRDEAKRMREEAQAKREQERASRMGNNQPFGRTTMFR